MAAQIKLRRDTALNWYNSNPTLSLGEPGIETDTQRIKFGTGTTTWRNLPYSKVDYADIVNKPEVITADFKGSVFADDSTLLVDAINGNIPYSVLSGAPVLATVATSGNYNDLTNKPTLFSGSYNDLTNKPTLFSGSYNDLTNKPTLFSGDVKGSVFADDSTLLVDGVNGSIPYSVLSGAPVLATVATSGSYNDLTNKPSIPSLTGYATESYVSVQINNLIDSAPGTLNTLNELAAALNDDSNFASNITTIVNNKISKPTNGLGEPVNSLGYLYNNGTGTVTWSTVDRLSHNGDEVVLVGGANPYVTFPAITGGDQLQIQGAEVSSTSGSLALTSQDNLNIIANGSGTAPGGSKSWTFGDNGSLTLPGELHGSTVTGPGGPAGRTVNITPADDASNKKFSFRIDQFGETFTRAYLEFPLAENNKQVAAVFPHANNTNGYIFTQGNNTVDDGMNNAFNIFYNNGNIKITPMSTVGGGTLYTWTFGNNGNLTFPNATVQTTAFTGNAATVDITNTNGIDTNYSITFVENRDGAEILRADVDLTFNSWSNTLTAGNVTTGVLKIEDGVHEKFQALVDATGIVTHDCSLGHVFYHTSPDADWTANFTNLNLASGYATAVTLVIAQGATGYYPSAVQIGGVAQTLNWQGNTTPTPSSSRTDVVTFSILNNSGTYTVLGQLTGF